MNESNDLLEGHNDPIGNRHRPLELALALQTMAYLWTQDTLDDLMVDLLFAHGLSWLFLSATAPPFILPPGTVRMYCPHCFKDPVLAHGISDAFHDAELLAEAIDIGLSGRRPLPEALADYEHRRNETALPLYELNSQMAALEAPPPDMQRLLGALHRNPVEAGRYLAALGGTISPAEFFAPDNIARILNGLSQ
jgi:hypothetical protein